MRRLLCLLILALLPLSAVTAQDVVQTEQPQPPPPETAPATPETAPPGDTAPATETAPPAPEIPVLVNTRSDMELLATQQLGGERPVGWNGSLDVNNPQLAILIRLDLEVLAGSLLGTDTRPAAWFGAVPSTPFALARDIRHDLEVLADAALGFNIRPDGWIGDNPIMRCNRATQTLVSLLELGGVFILEIENNSPDFCAQAEIQASRFTEINLLSNPITGGGTVLGLTAGAAQATINSNFAVAFLDRGAALRVGILPFGTPIKPVARSYAEFSNMMLIEGDNFQVFVDYQFTSVSRDLFEALPDVSSTEHEPFCGANWCSAG